MTFILMSSGILSPGNSCCPAGDEIPNVVENLACPACADTTFVTTTEAGSSSSTHRVLIPCHWCLHEAGLSLGACRRHARSIGAAFDKRGDLRIIIANSLERLCLQNRQALKVSPSAGGPWAPRQPA